MVHYKLYLLFLILSVFVICSISIEQKSRNGDSALDVKKKGSSQEREEKRRKDKQQRPINKNDDDDDVDDSHGSLSSYADNRYTAVPSEANYRTRARWPAPPPPPSSSSPFDDFMDGSDWPRFEFPSAFPSSLQSILFDNTPILNSGPTCNSLVDPQYPIFSDICGAVPQARYALPNAFGHRERWQVAQILTAILGSSSEGGCTRSLRLLLCPVLFPPCPTRHEPAPVLPCQSYCRAVKARCAMPALDLLPCEVLPYSSDLCPTNQPFGSLVPPNIFPSVNQPFLTPNAFPTPNFPTPQGFPSLQALFSSQGFQPTLNPSPVPTSVSSAPAGQPTAFFNLYNGGPFGTDSLTPSATDYSSRSYPNDYRQGARYMPITRSSTETRSTAEARPQSANEARLSNAATRPLATSSVVKA